MPELAAELEAERGVKADPSSLSRVLCEAGLTYKKGADWNCVEPRTIGLAH